MNENRMDDCLCPLAPKLTLLQSHKSVKSDHTNMIHMFLDSVSRSLPGSHMISDVGPESTSSKPHRSPGIKDASAVAWESFCCYICAVWTSMVSR